jgi:hypothetical protein
MSYIECPDCKKKVRLFGEGKSQSIAEELSVPLLAEMPINPDLAVMVDNGAIENADTSVLSKAVEVLEKL